MFNGENVCLLTVDSCRLDTAMHARTPWLDKLGPCLPSETSATFTLPAHWAIFSGFLPIQPRGARLLGEYDRIWRPKSARSTSARCYQYLSSGTLMDHYAAVGSYILGLGGVQFFDPASSSNSLPKLFPNFRYVGASAGSDDLISGRAEMSLPCGVISETVSDLLRHEPFFFFANLSETHMPYTTPACGPLPVRVATALEAVRQVAAFEAPREKVESLGLPVLRELHHLQVSALEWVDSQLGIFFSHLQKADRPTMVVVCADHGESFGEDGRIGHGHPGPAVTTVPLWVGRICP